MYQIDRREIYSDKRPDKSNSYSDVIMWFIIIAVIWGLVSIGKSNDAAEKAYKEGYENGYRMGYNDSCDGANYMERYDDYYYEMDWSDRDEYGEYDWDI